MAKPSETPQIFCTQANYSTLTARSSRNGTPTKVDAGNAWRNEGAKPAEGSPAQAFNFEANIWSKYVRWVWEGKSTADADAHIVETNNTGKAAIRSAEIGLAGVVPAGNNVFSVRGDTTGKFGAIFDFTGKNTTNAAIQFYSAQRTVATFDCAEAGSDHAYGFYPGVIGRFKGHGFLAHERGLTGGQIKPDFSTRRAMFTAHATNNAYAFMGVGDAGLLDLRRKTDSNSNAPIAFMLASTNSVGKVLHIIQQTPRGNSSAEHAINVDVLGSGNDQAVRTPLFVNGGYCDGSMFISSNPTRAGFSGASFAAGAWLKRNGTSNIGQGSAGFFAAKNPGGGSALRAVRGTATRPLEAVEPNLMAHDVRLVDEGNQHVSMSYSPSQALSTFNPGSRLGISAHKRTGNTPLLQVRRGSTGEGFATESVMLTNARPIHYISASNAGQPLSFIAGNTTLNRIDSAGAVGPAPRMPYPVTAQITIRVSFNATISVNTDVQISLIIRDDTANTDIHLVDLGSARNPQDSNQDKVFNYCGTVYKVIPGGHRAFSSRIQVTASGSQGQPVGVINDSCMEIHCLASEDGD